MDNQEKKTANYQKTSGAEMPRGGLNAGKKDLMNRAMVADQNAPQLEKNAVVMQGTREVVMDKSRHSGNKLMCRAVKCQNTTHQQIFLNCPEDNLSRTKTKEKTLLEKASQCQCNQAEVTRMDEDLKNTDILALAKEASQRGEALEKMSEISLGDKAKNALKKADENLSDLFPSSQESVMQSAINCEKREEMRSHEIEANRKLEKKALDVLERAEKIEDFNQTSREIQKEDLFYRAFKADKSTFSIEDEKEFSNFEFALYILRKHMICRLAEEDSLIWIFDGKSYTPLSDERLEALVYQEIPEEIKREVLSCKTIKKAVAEYIKDECYPDVIQRQKLNRKVMVRVFTPQELKSIDNCVVLNNGVFDAKKRKVLGFDSRRPYYFRVHANLLNPTIDSLCTPYFDKLLCDATEGDKDTIRMIHYVLGMLIMPNKCKKFPVVGPASNSGKSVLFGQFLESLFDPSRISRVSSTALAGRFSLGSADDKILISCMDMDLTEISAGTAGIIKRATGEEKITVEEKYKKQHEMTVRFHFLFGTNGSFSTAKYDSGWVNRIIAVPFIHEMPENKQDADLIKRLFEEKDAIITKILYEMGDVIGGDGAIKIPESDLSVRMKNSWTLKNTFFSDFLQNHIQVTGRIEDAYSRDEIYESYQRFFNLKVLKSAEKAKNQRLTKTQLITKILDNNKGRIWTARVIADHSNKYESAVNRICGLKLI